MLRSEVLIGWEDDRTILPRHPMNILLLHQAPVHIHTDHHHFHLKPRKISRSFTIAASIVPMKILRTQRISFIVPSRRRTLRLIFFASSMYSARSALRSHILSSWTLFTLIYSEKPSRSDSKFTSILSILFSFRQEFSCFRSTIRTSTHPILESRTVEAAMLPHHHHHQQGNWKVGEKHEDTGNHM